MSRIAKTPVEILKGVSVNLENEVIEVKGPKGYLMMDINSSVEVLQNDNILTFIPRNKDKLSSAIVGTTRSLVHNMIVGVTTGFQKSLQLKGVGYRAVANGNILTLTLGFSHPINYVIPPNISVECPNQTTLVISGSDKQVVGQVSADIRNLRPSEPYKGKGICYVDEYIRRKEAKKK